MDEIRVKNLVELKRGLENIFDERVRGLYGEKGFTDKVYRILEMNGIIPYVDTRKYDAVVRYYVPGRLMLKIAGVLPRKNVEEGKHNEAPVFRDLLELARLIPDETYYQIIVVGKERNDERVAIEGVCVKKNYWDKMEKTIHGEETDEVVRLLKYYLGHRPDNIWNKVLGGEEYVCMWWD